MAVRVRLFAALREAAGTGELQVDPAPLPVLLDALRERFGEPFTTRLRVAGVLLDGYAVAQDAALDVPDGAELALLPPVSGGAGGADPAGPLAAADPGGRPVAGAPVAGPDRSPPTLPGGMARALTFGGLALPAFVALVLGPGPFAVVLTLLAVLALVDFSGVLSRAAARPILPAALIPAAGLPVTVALRPELGWDLVPGFVAAGFLATFLFALLFGRRRGIVQGAGTTMLAGLVVGLGAASLVLLRSLPHGFRWVLVFGLLVAAADLGGPLAAVVRARRGGPGHGRAADGGPARLDPAAAHGLLGPVVAAVAVAGPSLLLLRPPLQPPVTALLTLVALSAALGGGDLRRSLVAEAETAADPAGEGDGDAPRSRRAAPERTRIGGGIVMELLDAVLFGAPVAYVLARSAAL